MKFSGKLEDHIGLKCW